MISGDISLNEQETAILSCVGVGEPYVEVHWSFNGTPIANTSLSPIFEENVVRGARLYKQSHLRLCSLGAWNAGRYTCTASNGVTSADATTQLIVAS